MYLLGMQKQCSNSVNLVVVRISLLIILRFPLICTGCGSIPVPYVAGYGELWRPKTRWMQALMIGFSDFIYIIILYFSTEKCLGGIFSFIAWLLYFLFLFYNVIYWWYVKFLQLQFRFSRSLIRNQVVNTVRSKHTLPELPYAYDALAPVLSSELLQVHHKKHHQVIYCFHWFLKNLAFFIFLDYLRV